MAVHGNKVIKSEVKKGVYVVVRRTYHNVELISAHSAKRDADVVKNKLDKEFEGKRRVFDYYEIHKVPMFFNSKTKNKK